MIIHIYDAFGTKGDANQFKQWGTTLKRFMQPEDDAMRAYTIEDMRKVIDYLIEAGVKPVEPEHLYYGIVANIIDGRLGQARASIDIILSKQAEYEYQDSLGAKIPNGW